MNTQNRSAFAHVFRALAFGVMLIPLGCSHQQSTPPAHQGYTKDSGAAVIPPRCTAAWNALVDRRLKITDSSGHGPDIGSLEWQRAVGRKSGVEDGSGHGPDTGSDEWCRAVDFKVFGRR
jgi:hypothetical protein